MVCTCGFNQDKTLLQTTHPYNYGHIHVFMSTSEFDTAGMTQDCMKATYIYIWMQTLVTPLESMVV